MSAYIIRRLLFMIPTLLGIMLVSFVVVQFAPGGPVERVIAQLSGSDTGASSRIPGSGQGGDFGWRGAQGGSAVDATTSKYRGAQGLDPEFIKKLELQFGFDKPAYERFFLMLKNFIVFDFGPASAIAFFIVLPCVVLMLSRPVSARHPREWAEGR